MSRLLTFLLIVFAMLLLLVAVPVLAPLAALLNALDRRRLRAAAGGMRCVCCGHSLGQAALDAADAAWAGQLADLRRRFPNARIRLVRHVHACCTACGAEYGWDARTRTLALRPVPPEP